MADLLALFKKDQEQRSLSRATIELRERQFSLYESETGKKLDQWTTKEDINAFLDSRKLPNGEPVSAKTRSCYLTSFSALFKFGVREDLVPFNPVDKIVRPKVKPGVPNPIPEAQFQRAFKDAKPLMRCWLALERYAGLRCMEVSQLQREHILVDQKVIRVVNGKGGKARNVKLTPTILKCLTEYGMNERGRLWPHSPSNVSQQINRYYHGLGIEHTAHKNRHRYGTDLYALSGKDIITTAKGLGHSNIQTSAIYAQVDDEDLSIASFKMDPGSFDEITESVEALVS